MDLVDFLNRLVDIWSLFVEFRALWPVFFLPTLGLFGKEVFIAQNLFCAIAALSTKPFLFIFLVFIRIMGKYITLSVNTYITPIQRRFGMSVQG